MSGPGARRFTNSSSLSQSISSSNGMAVDDKNRSMEGAKEATDAYRTEKQEPLRNSVKEVAKKGITYAAQDKLPRLPIPELESSMKKYLAALEPLQTHREHEETKIAVKDFLEHDGKELQAKLKAYSAGKSSYIEQFWYDSYLNYDNPVVLNLNPFFLLEDDPTPARNDQNTRAASLIISALCFIRAVRKEELPPDTIRGQPLDMYQYSRMFGTARVPTDHGCIIGQDSDSKHLVVMSRGQFYWFDVLDHNNDLIMTEKDIAQNLASIAADADEIPIQEAAKGAIGVLSTENRKTWSSLRDLLTKDEGSNNAECLNTVDTALFLVCLDYTEPADVSELCGNMLCGTNEVVKGVQVGTCTNRWYDKLQLIVCKNGSAGINFEHTGVDGHTVLRFASDVYTDTILRYAKSINGQAPSLWTSMSPDPTKRDPESFGDVSTTPHKLEWDMIPELQIALRFAETRLADLIHQNEFQTLDFHGYGKNFITSMGFSPDAFVQMAFQAAYYGLYGRIENTYEPAMTKMYLHGRTEAIRSVTPESAEFVKTFWASELAQKKIDALKKAAAKHTAITRDCSKAQGQDRHLYALYCVWQRQVNAEGAEPSSEDSDLNSSGDFSPANGVTSNGNGEKLDKLEETHTNGDLEGTGPIHRVTTANSMPTLFTDPGWEKINSTMLSTSNCGNPALRHFGFGPVSGDGFGIGYIIKDDSLSVCASSKHRQTRRFMDALEAYLNEIRRLLKQTAPKDAPQSKASRAREIEEKTGKDGRVKSRGRIIKTGGEKHAKGTETPVSVAPTEGEEDDEYGLDGYGFFDAGTLLQALKKKEEAKPTPAEAVAQRKRAVGKKLALTEY